MLSGYVLTESLIRQRPVSGQRLLTFYIRRAARVYPALWLTITLALLYVVVARHSLLPPDVSPWWRPSARQVPSASSLSLTFLGIKSVLPIPVWTLCIELIGSLIIPFVAWLVHRNTFVLVVAILALSVVSLMAGTRALLIPQHLVDFFIGGAVVPLVAVINVRKPSRSVIAGVALVAFLVVYFGRYLVGADFFSNYFSAQASLIEAIGSMMLISVISAGRAHFSTLRHQALVLLGDVSYSLYLIHLTIMASTAYLLHEVIGLYPFGESSILATLVLMFVTLALAFSLSLLSYKYVELPGIKAGKVIAERLRRGGRASITVANLSNV